MNLLASGPEDLDFPGEETDSERSLAVMVEVGVMVLEWRTRAQGVEKCGAF